MKTNFLIFIFIAFSSLFNLAKAVAPTDGAPNPTPDMNGADRWKVRSIYGYYGEDTGKGVRLVIFGGAISNSFASIGEDECLMIQKENKEAWAATIIRPQSGNYFDFSGYDKIHLQVWDDENAGNFKLFLINDAYDTTPIPLLSPVVKNQWNEYEFDIPTAFGDMTKVYGVVVEPNWSDNKAYYIDNIYLTRSSRPDDEPTNWLTPPERSSRNFLSLYNDEPYGSTPNTFAPVWSANVSEYLLATGQYVQKMNFTSRSGGGVKFDLPAARDLTPYTYVHFDIWPVEDTPANRLGIALYKEGGTDADRSRLNIGKSAPAKTWTSFDMKLSDFPRQENMPIFKTLRFEANSGVWDTLSYYIDNVYFYFAVDIPAPIPTHSDVISLFSNSYTNQDGTWAGVTDGAAAANDYKRVGSLSDGGSFELTAPVSVSAKNLLHMDVFIEDENVTELQLMLSDNSGTNSSTISIVPSQLESGKWNRLNILLSDFGTVNLSAIKKITFSGSEYAVYLDNIYFYYESPTTTESPVPGHINSPNILSVYSDYYANATPNPGSGFSTLGTVEKEFGSTGNHYRLLPGMSQYTNVDLGTGISTSEWNFMHFDVQAATDSSDLIILMELEEPDGTPEEATIVQNIRSTDGWVNIDLSTSDADMPLGSKIMSLKLASSNEILFVDNVYFYKSESSQQNDVVEVTGANEETAGEVNRLYSCLYDAFAVISATDQTGATIEVLMHDNSIEDRKISVYGSTWDSLTIKPAPGTPSGTNYTITFKPLASLDQTTLFDFQGVRNIAVDGRINGNDERGLTFVGFYNVNASYWSFDRNTILRFANGTEGNTENMTVRNCVFTNPALNPDDPMRSISAITVSNVHNATILNNEFRNCLSLNVPEKEVETGVVDLREDNDLMASGANRWVVSGNRFYETETNLPFADLSYVRAFVNVHSRNTELNILINDNTIGGNSMSGTGSFTHTGTSSHVKGISYAYEAEVPMTGKVTIENNTVSNINFDNQTTYFKYRESGITYTEGDQLAFFVGIYTHRGNVEIVGNTVENVAWKATEVSTGDALQSATGILFMADKTDDIKHNLVCSNNKVKDISFKMTPAGNYKMNVSFNGIRVLLSRESTVKINDNIVIWGINDSYTYGITSGFNGLFVHDYSTKTTAEVFNNTVLLKDFIAGPEQVYNASAYWFYIQNPLSDNAVFNIYNNIAFVQGTNFVNPGSANGIRCSFYSTLPANRINLYQNTILVDNLNGQNSTGIAYSIEKDGKMRSWNNNIVNMNANGKIITYNDGDYIGEKNPVLFDYNNYYSPKPVGGEYYFATGWSETTGWKGIRTFDNWKFNNTIWLFDNKGEQDFHSSFVNPLFNNSETNAVSIPYTFAGMEQLKNLLKPNSFIAGHKLSGLPGTGKDINAIDRNVSMPTAGAVEADLPNCWIGGYAENPTDWNTPENWSKNIPGDFDEIVFHPNPQGNLVLDQDRKISNVFNASEYNLIVNGHDLTISGLVRMDAKGKVDATNPQSKIIYVPGVNEGAVIQHLYDSTYLNDKVSNLMLTNQTDYFVLLYDKLEITDQLTMQNGVGNGKGALNCYYYDTELKFSGMRQQEIPEYTIYNDTVYNLTINGAKVIANESYIYVNNDLTINSGKTFEINAGKFVKVDGNTTNSAGVYGLVIRSTDALPTATFIFSQDNPTVVPATVGMYSKANMDPNGATGYKYKWQYFTVPVETVPAFGIFDGSWLRQWNEAAGNLSGPPYWFALNNSSSLTALNGYEITQNNSKVINIPGNLVNRDFNKVLTYTPFNNESYPGYDDQDAMSGQHVIGNPYTAAINIKELKFGTNLDSTVYIFNTGSYKDWSEGGRGGEGENPGQYVVVPVNNAGVAGLPDQIPSMQGFVVMRKDDTGSDADNTFTLNYNSAIAKNNSLLRARPAERSYTIVDMESEHYSDRLRIFLEPTCKKGFDNGWDGRKFVNMSAGAQVFTMEDEEYFQVSTMDELDETYVGIKSAEEDSEYTITFTHTNIDDYSSIKLIDLQENKSVDITESGSSYTFSVSEPGSVEKRFLISTNTIITGGDEVEDANKDILVYTQNKTIVVSNVNNLSGKLFLYDISGKLLLTKPFDKSEETRIETNFLPGVYVLKIETENNNFNQSVILY